jgi:hypothetical protein
MQVDPFLASALRAPSLSAVCTCQHYRHCDHACHHRACDPTQNACDLTFLPDEGGLTPWGCRECTPGEDAPHFLGCDLIGWNVPTRQNLSA